MADWKEPTPGPRKGPYAIEGALAFMSVVSIATFVILAALGWR